MHTLLDYLCHDNPVRIGEWVIQYQGDATLSARHDRSLMSPMYKTTLTGLKQLLAYIDSNPHGH